MNYRYKNGETSDYLGVSVNNGQEILLQLVDILSQSTVNGNSVTPWFIDDQISLNQFFTCQGTDGEYPCFLKVSNNSQTGLITFTASLDNNYNVLSNQFQIPYEINGENRLYATCSDGFLAVQIFRVSNLNSPFTDGIFFGFLEDRSKSVDPWAIIIGTMDILKSGTTQISKDVVTNSINWYQINSAFRDATIDDISSSSLGLGDVLIKSWLDPIFDNFHYGFGGNPLTASSQFNILRNAQNGIIDQATGLPELDVIRIVEGYLNEFDHYNETMVLKENKTVSNNKIWTRGYLPKIILRGSSNIIANSKISTQNNGVYNACGIGKLAMRISD